MSIFKESFKDSVQKQIKIRENQIGSPNRNQFLQRQCTIRMASGVDITPNLIFSDSSFEAKNHILEGGLKPFNNSLRGGFKGAYDAPKDGYGYVPMPGITSVNIQTLSAYGSLRGATVKFECHNREQLDILELLYMRPGYPCLLEWGWLPHLDNEGTNQNNIQFISDNKLFFEKTKYTQDSLQKEIVKKKEDYNSNYDGLYGIVKNFNISVRPDGGFSCTTELIAMGEVLSSLKGNMDKDNPSQHSLEEFLENFNEYATSITNFVPDEDLEEAIEEREEASTKTIPRKNLLGNRSKRVIQIEQDELRKRRPKAISLLLKIQALNFKRNKDYIINTQNLNTDSRAEIYIRWGSFIEILNNIVIPIDSKNNSIIKFEHNNLDFNKVNIPDDLNLKIKGELSDEYGVGFFDTSTFNKTIALSVNPQICLYPLQVNDIFGINLGDPSEYNKIKNIYFEVSYLLKTFKSQYENKDELGDVVVNENFSIGNYVKKIWDDVNNSSGNSNNFQLNNNFEKTHTIRIIDLEFQKNIALTNEKIIKLNVLNTKSIVRDFNFDLSIPSALTSTIAIMAQNPNDAENLNDVTFAAFNKGITNRFFTQEKDSKQVYLGPINEPKGSKQFKKLVKMSKELQMYLNRLQPLLNDGQEPFIVKEVKQIENKKGDNKAKLSGDSYTDFDVIPSSDISTSRIILKQIKTLIIDMERYDYNDDAFPLKSNPTPSITSIIPLKFNAKLDGISDIVIGNVFKIDGTRLPQGYTKSNIAFIVLGEQQEINGQDWTTTITGQAILLPI